MKNKQNNKLSHKQHKPIHTTTQQTTNKHEDNVPQRAVLRSQGSNNSYY